MKHFVAFQKRKGLVLQPGTAQNKTLAYQIQAELFKYGFVLTQELFSTLCTQTEATLTEVYSDLCKGLERGYGTGGYEPIYRNFPQSVKNMEYIDFLVNAIMHYWSWGTWRPEDEGYMQREFALEAVNYKEVKLLTEAQFQSIFTDIVYSGSSISKWDKEIVDWFIDSGNSPEIEFSQISFKETKAYIGKRYLENGIKLPVGSATDVLRIYAAYSGGDEGLKENTKFKQPNRKIKRALLSTLDGCYDLEESFKTYREPWLKVLFYLNPLSKDNKGRFTNLVNYTIAIRNNPKSLRTFNSYLEEALNKKDPEVFNLLKRRKGVYMRRMNQLYSIFGMKAIDEFLKLNPTFSQLVTLYNYFGDRTESKDRAVVLANQNVSAVNTFGALEALPEKVVRDIQGQLRVAMYDSIKRTDKKVYIDRSLYYSPLALNNRGSSFSTGNVVIGKVDKLVDVNTVRAYVHWVSREDIDLSGMVITKDLDVVKVGWNGTHTYGKMITYSGDNTGHSAKNAEYLDIDIKELSKTTVEWVIVDAKVFRGPVYANWKGEGVHAGWMKRNSPEKNAHWLPETTANAMKIQSNAISAYLMAVHIPTQNVVYLDVAQTNESIITTSADAMKMKIFLEKIAQFDDGSAEINWKKLNQGHIINLLAKNIVSTPEEAELVFDENTQWETIAKALNEETL